MIELLAPAGNFERLETAIRYGADAVYLAYKKFGLRAFADNFDLNELKRAVDFCHQKGKKVYVTVNILAHERDFELLPEFLTELNKIKPDGAIVSDLGVATMVKKYAPLVELHLSTQANLTNKYSADAYVDFGFKRLVLARELSIPEIKAIRDHIPDEIELEAFVHGAMCISYSGRCLLSNFLTGRSGNNGECAQSCRWEYFITERQRPDEQLQISQDDRGTYILNSKDMNMIEHIDKLADAGVSSFKIEGRVKTSYYVASVVNAYRRAIDYYNKHGKPYNPPREIVDDLLKPSHRRYCTGFYLGDTQNNECYDTSKPKQNYDFIAVVTDTFNGGAVVEMRNRFKVGETLEVLSPNDYHNTQLTVEKLTDLNGEEVLDAMLVKQKLKLYTTVPLQVG
ncbi:MAG: U32 family peptidase, partial [Clostridia bacterium]|nr:U32 family peptidase [Clostridia bacterium]